MCKIQAAAGNAVMVSPQATSGNVSIIAVHKAVSAVIAEIDLMTTFKQEQKYELAEFLGRKICFLCSGQPTVKASHVLFR